MHITPKKAHSKGIFHSVQKKSYTAASSIRHTVYF